MHRSPYLIQYFTFSFDEPAHYFFEDDFAFDEIMDDRDLEIGEEEKSEDVSQEVVFVWRVPGDHEESKRHEGCVQEVSYEVF